ncbi:hypothetical protein PLESTB_000214700 [Pleodorina starrii]|uniref:Uncharacterized protein n=1 Tax=Pleodorina starrii TaxID=330485 RepID=A0A9W6EYM4_9CHLO|nr:hypothetical protein PLESTM_001540400 [Pleodorina starrii]GLC49395.1 hypothetical protein PLESTB_000214700 [Pleodorina starrii]GLC73342.1 hypothetical protein PLESTF_001365200 [Pleodorina starrii]
MSKLLARAGKNVGRTAVISNKQVYSYDNLLTAAESITTELAKKLRNPSQLKGATAASAPDKPPRVGLYADPGPEYLAATWAVWQAGGIVVPLATSHPPPELSYVCQDAGVSAVLTLPDQESRLGPIARQHGAALQLLEPLTGSSASSASGNGSVSGTGNGSGRGRDAEADEAAAAAILGELRDVGASDTRGALIIYTSGTTGKPKGVLHTHRSLHAQVHSLASSWHWRPSDRLLHCLPLHHIHGIVNALYCPAAVGASVEFMPKFSPGTVWQRLQSGDISVFMGVPTMYSYLLSAYEGAASEPERQSQMREAARALRLTVSGSSACPVPIMNRWRELSGDFLLERYGMTEIGMALSNPYEGERRPGSVGTPLPGVEARIAADGQLLIRGPPVFAEYWGRPGATREAFDAEGFFLTGDTASTSGSPPYFSIEGRTSVDIIKSSGYKISALQIESVIMEHPAISEVAVLGVPDETFGEVVTALVAAKQPQPQPQPQTSQTSQTSQTATGADAAERAVAVAARPEVGELQRFCRERLAAYQVPKRWQWVSALPRNAMGKVNKKELLRMLQAGELA